MQFLSASTSRPVQTVKRGNEAQTPHPDPALILWWIILGAFPIVIDRSSDGILERGDGIQHFQFAAYSWQDPKLFLDMWGKPLFTLLASPFAQFGLPGMTVFNSICFICTAWTADGILKRAGIAARWLFAPVLLLVPVYGTMVLAGMTEVLFGLLTVLAVRAAYEERPVVFALVVSMMPFSRPEYIGFLPFAVIWLCWHKHWRAIPFLLTGHLVFAVFAGFVLVDPLWAIRGDPYVGAADIYGSGRLDHFIQHIDVIYGTLCFPLAIAMIMAPAEWRAGKFRMANGRILVWLTILPAIIIFLIHSYLWWKGLKGSLGLTRVLATTAPLLVLFTCWILVRAGSAALKDRFVRTSLTALLGLLYLTVAADTFLSIRPIPVEMDEQEKLLNRVIERIGPMMVENTRVAFHDPYIGFRLDADRYSDDTRTMIDGHRDDLGLQEGDLVIWDAHFAPNEGYTPLEWLLDHPALRLVDYMETPMPMIVLGGRQYAVAIFERRDTRRWSGTIDLVDQQEHVLPHVPYRINADLRPNDTWIFGGEEYPFEILQAAGQHDDVIYARIEINGTLDMPPVNEPLLFAFAEFNDSGILNYKDSPILPGDFNLTFLRPIKTADAQDKLYLWNRSGIGFSLTDLKIQVYLHRSSP